MIHDLSERLESMYRRFNKRCYIHPDPLEMLYHYTDAGDREIAGFISAALAYGNVRQILNSITTVLDIMGPSPRRYLLECAHDDFFHDLNGFVHRFATGYHMSAMLTGLKEILVNYGTLKEGFAAGVNKTDTDYCPALGRFVENLRSGCRGHDPGHLIASPEKGSACKRLHLFLRWMIRKDDVDPGGWDDLSSHRLVVPLDTHMFRVCRELGFTERKQANLKSALEITSGFSKINPEDPVRYDFVLTRQGIRKDSAMAIDAGC